MRRRVVTIKDVARSVGVSVSTVSRVLNDTSYVSAQTRQIVLQAIRELHFEPSQIARRFANKRTATVGLLIPDVANPFFSDVARGAEDMAIEEGRATILCNSDWKSERQPHPVKKPRAFRPIAGRKLLPRLGRSLSGNRIGT
jgi:LacI family transcriptional regulator